jgi:hypothetical protein
MATIIITEITMAAMTMLATKSGSFLMDRIAAIGVGEAKVTAGVPHLWQNLAFSSSLVPQFRQ